MHRHKAFLQPWLTDSLMRIGSNMAIQAARLRGRYLKNRQKLKTVCAQLCRSRQNLPRNAGLTGLCVARGLSQLSVPSTLLSLALSLSLAHSHFPIPRTAVRFLLLFFSGTATHHLRARSQPFSARPRRRRLALLLLCAEGCTWQSKKKKSKANLKTWDEAGRGAGGASLG